MFSFLSLNRSSAFQDRQIRNLFTRYYKHRAHFKETMMRYEVEKSKALRRGRHDRDKLDELERREAFLQGRKEHLHSEITESLSGTSEDSVPLYGSPPRTTKIRKKEAAASVSIFQASSGFLDSGNWIFSSSLLSPLYQPIPH